MKKKELIVIDSICEKCKKEFQQTIKKDSIDKNNISRFCCRTCANTRNHTTITKLQISNSVKNSDTWKTRCNTHLENLRASPTYQIKTANCKYCGKEFSYSINVVLSKRLYCSETCHENDPNKKKMGGYRLNSGRGKSGWYKGIYCGSSYELAWIIYNFEHDIKFERNFQGFDYVFDNEIHKYYPDFIMDDFYIEIKGFKRSSDDEKWNSFPHNLKILFKKDLKKELNYVIKKYGRDFTSLYDINYKNRKLNSCEICGEPCKNIVCHNKRCQGLLSVKRKKEKNYKIA